MKQAPLPTEYETDITLDGEDFWLSFGINAGEMPYCVKLISKESGCRFDLDDCPHDESKIIAACYAELERWR